MTQDVERFLDRLNLKRMEWDSAIDVQDRTRESAAASHYVGAVYFGLGNDQAPWAGTDL